MNINYNNMFYVKVNKYTKIKLYNLTTVQYKQYFNDIIKIFEDDNIFYSITKDIKSDYFSLFIQICDLSNILDQDNMIIKDFNIFNIFSIYEYNSGINHFGIVSNISSIFSKYNISIIYVNTFNQNLIFINENDYEKALESLTILVDSSNIIYI